MKTGYRQRLISSILLLGLLVSLLPAALAFPRVTRPVAARSQSPLQSPIESPLQMPTIATVPSSVRALPERLIAVDTSNPVPDSLEGEPGLTILLSEGAEQPVAPGQAIAVAGTPLDEAATQAILDRLPPLEAEEDDAQDFRLPEASLPPPKTGEVLETTFPAATEAASPATTEAGPLEVLRYAPEGDVPLAPFLNVTFNQPMVPLATLDQLSDADVPVILTPTLPGHWKWLGTRTLIFEHSDDEIDRFPMATEYQVEVPAGTTSAVGGVLAESVTWTFRTPAPRVTASEPSFSPQPRDPLIFVAFDQRIDPAAVLESTSARAQDRAYPLRLADEEEIVADERVQRLVDSTPEGRWLAFRAVEPFPANTTVNVAVGPNTPSTEGSLVTTESQTFSFQTYAPLRVDESRCGRYGDECPPYSSFSIIFNNPLDAAYVDETIFTVVPAIDGQHLQVYGNHVEIGGATLANTAYEVTVDGALQDIFGQPLGESQTLSFETTAAPSILTGPGDFVTVDPSSTMPSFTVYSINYPQLDVRAYAVQPEDWAAYTVYLRQHRYEENPPDPPGQLVLSETIQVDGVEGHLTETTIDLSELLDGETGHLILAVETPNIPIISDIFGRGDRRVLSWVQVTQIGLDAVSDHSELTAWATSLQDGTPLGDVELSLLPGGPEVITNADGVATLPLSDRGNTLLTGRLDDDVAMLPASGYYWDEIDWQQRPVNDTLRWYVFDDRQMYRPGEDVHIKGWMRLVGGGQTGDVGLPSTEGLSVRYRLFDARGNEILDGVAEVNDLAGFDMAFTLPENMNLGHARLELQPEGLSDLSSESIYHTHAFQVQEFRRPEFEVVAGNESEGPFFVGDEAVVSVSATYFAGGPLPNAETFWSVTAAPGSYAPPNWPDFVFGEWAPWWRYYGEPNGDSNRQTYQGRTDAAGRHYLNMDFIDAEEPRPYSVFASADVLDVNRQAWNAGTSLLVHPSERYVGLRSERTFVERGEPLVIEAIVTDIEGNTVAGRVIEMEATRLEWNYANGGWTEEEVDLQSCIVESIAVESTMASTATASTSGPATCTFDTAVGGEYRVTATVLDDQDRLNRTRITRWVSGGIRPPARNVEQERVELIPNKEQYEPGDVAEILVQAPFAPAEGLLTVSRSGILYSERFAMGDSSTILHVPIDEGHIPNLAIQVNLSGSAPRVDDEGNPVDGAPERPAFASGQLDLPVPPLSRTLALEIVPEETALAPGESTVIDLTLADADGLPVADGELAVVVVDEAILALTDYQLADPLAIFYQSRSGDTSTTYGRDTIVLDSPDLLVSRLDEMRKVITIMETGMPVSDEGGAITFNAMPDSMEMAESSMVADQAMAAPMAARAAAPMPTPPGEPAAAIDVRADFNPLALFAPDVRTDQDGRARIVVTLPDNLTRYRIMVVSVAGDNQFGSAESNMTARMPLMVRPSAPRFLNFGDRAQLPVVLQNQTDEAMDVAIVAQVANLTLAEGAGQAVTVPANDRVEVRFPAETENAGTARVRFAAVAGPLADAAQVEMPVYTPATTEAFATYGVVDVDVNDGGAVVQPVATPRDIFPQFGGLEINTSSTALQSLTDAVLYLTNYPFESSAQLASRILGVGSLRDVLSAFQADGLPAPDELNAAIERDIEQLQGMQNYDGGFSTWRRNERSVPFSSVHAAHALALARSKGYAVDQETLDRSLNYLRNIENVYPSWYSAQTKHALSAYALYTRQLLGDVDTAKAGHLLNAMPLDEQSLEAISWLWQVLGDDPTYADQVAAISRHVNNSAVETPGAANFVTSYGDDEWVMLHSNRRTDGIVLDALIGQEPESDLIPKVVNGLLAHRTQGRWSNTQENVFILLALDRYFNTFEAQSPDFVARIWLGDTYAGEHEYVEYTTDSHATDVPMAYLADSDGSTQDVIVAKDGDGRLYYRLGLRYSPDDLDLDPLDMGFVVQRTYEAVDDPEDVRQDEDGVWHIKAGARVRIALTMVADSRRYHVALVDPLPAGLEIINPDLAVSVDLPEEPGGPEPYRWWRGPWYQHQNLRDHQAEAFTTQLWDGVYDYTYTARATTPGHFVVPPAKAEEMYSPEVFGRSGSDVVVVE